MQYNKEDDHHRQWLEYKFEGLGTLKKFGALL